MGSTRSGVSSDPTPRPYSGLLTDRPWGATDGLGSTLAEGCAGDGAPATEGRRGRIRGRRGRIRGRRGRIRGRRGRIRGRRGRIRGRRGRIRGRRGRIRGRRGRIRGRRGRIRGRRGRIRGRRGRIRGRRGRIRGRRGRHRGGRDAQPGATHDARGPWGDLTGPRTDGAARLWAAGPAIRVTRCHTLSAEDRAVAGLHRELRRTRYLSGRVVSDPGRTGSALVSTVTSGSSWESGSCRRRSTSAAVSTRTGESATTSRTADTAARPTAAAPAAMAAHAVIDSQWSLMETVCPFHAEICA